MSAAWWSCWSAVWWSCWSAPCWSCWTRINPNFLNFNLLICSGLLWVPEGTRGGLRMDPSGRLSIIGWGSGGTQRRGLTSCTSMIPRGLGWPEWSRTILREKLRERTGLEMLNTRLRWYLNQLQALCLFLTGTMPYSHRHYALFSQCTVHTMMEYCSQYDSDLNFV